MSEEVSVESPNEKSSAGLEENVKRVLTLQVVFAVITLAIIPGYFYLTGVGDGSFENQQDLFGYLKAVVKALGFGSLLGIVNTILSARSVRRSSRAALTTPSLAMVPVYVGLLNKLVVIGGGIAFGLIALGLAPLFVVVGYAVSQAAFIVANLGIRKPNN